jgi:malonyl-CoA/methylmalonyl-CoA synthetase
VIDEIPGVLESAVIGLPHPDFGESVAAVVVRDGSADVDEAAITARTAEQLAKFKNPKKVYFVDCLPRNTMGKVQKNELRKDYETAFTK